MTTVQMTNNEMANVTMTNVKFTVYDETISAISYFFLSSVG